jgi:antitoxin component HigA of HigAB toxin-antitoxin module
MATALSAISDDPYLELVQTFPLRPIRSRNTHQRALAMLRSLTGKRGSAISDYKTVLASLVAEYERSTNSRLDTSKVTAAEIVLHLLEEHNMSINALAKALDFSQSSLSDMLNGRRDWSKTAIVRISNHFGLRSELFLR